MSDVALWQLVQDWLPDAGWEILRVSPSLDHATIRHGNSGIAAIYDDKVVMLSRYGVDSAPIKAVDPMFFCKLDLALTTIFSAHEWYKKKTSDVFESRTRKKIWPK